MALKPSVPASLVVCFVFSMVSPVLAALGRKLCIVTEPPIHQTRPSLILSVAPSRNNLNNGSMTCQHETMKLTAYTLE